MLSEVSVLKYPDYWSKIGIRFIRGSESGWQLIQRKADIQPYPSRPIGQPKPRMQPVKW